MATEKKQPENAGSTVSWKKISDVGNARDIKLRAKKSNAIKTKTAEKKRQIKRHRNWNSVTVDDPDIQHLLIGRPKLIESEKELITEFNLYLASCLEKTRKAKLVPVKTEELDQNKINILDDEEKGGKVKWKWGQTTITNNIISQFEIVEGQEWSKTPTIWGFLSFLWGITYTTWERRRDTERLGWTVELINNKLEEIRVDQAARGNINPSIAALILNVRYNRIPKKEVDNNIKGSIFKETDFIDD